MQGSEMGRFAPRRTTACHLWAATTLLTLALHAQAAPVQSRFEPTLRAEQGQALVLNGAGTRFRTVLRVYDLALYTPKQTHSREALINGNQPCRLEFVALRELGSTDIGLAFIRGMKANATREQVTRHLPAMSQLVDIFSSRQKLAEGDRFGMEYVPGKGTIFRIDGRPHGQPVGDAEFFRLVLGIWLGDSAVEPLLRDALLGL